MLWHFVPEQRLNDAQTNLRRLVIKANLDTFWNFLNWACLRLCLDRSMEVENPGGGGRGSCPPAELFRGWGRGKLWDPVLTACSQR